MWKLLLNKEILATWLLLILLTGCRPTAEVTPPVNSVEANPDAAKLAEDLVMLSSLASRLPEFASSESCAECHRERYDSFKLSDHSRSLRLPVPAEELHDTQFVHAISGREYDISVNDDGELFHAESIANRNQTAIPVGKHKISLVMGSGAFGKSYLVRIPDGFQQSPLGYYVGKHGYGMAPGYDHAAQRGFTRQITDQCLFCHAGLVSRIEDNLNRYQIHELAIGCERCHGPGAEHVRRYKTADQSVDTVTSIALTKDKIVNPKNMNREQVQSLCGQCHVQGNVSIYPQGSNAWSFRPGEELSKTKAEYFVGEGVKETGFVGHFTQLENSQCFQKSPTMTCVTCHDPHHEAPAGDLVAARRQQCLNCHTDDQCGVTHQRRVETNDNHCAACHMPRGDSEFPHIAVTNHRIATYREPMTKVVVPVRSTGLPKPVALLESAAVGSTQRKLNEALATAQWLLAEAGPEIKTPQNLRSAIEQLKSALDAEPNERIDAMVAVCNLTDGLIKATERELTTDDRLKLWKQTTEYAIRCERSPIASTEQRIDAISIMAAAAFAFGQYDKARARYEKMTTLRRDASDWCNLGICDGRLEKFEQAEAELNEAIRISPTYAYTYQVLAVIYESIDPIQSKKYSDMADQIEAAQKAAR